MRPPVQSEFQFCFLQVVLENRTIRRVVVSSCYGPIQNTTGLRSEPEIKHGNRVNSLKVPRRLTYQPHLAPRSYMSNELKICVHLPEETTASRMVPESKYNKAQSAGCRDLNNICVLTWRRENRREIVIGLSCKSQL